METVVIELSNSNAYRLLEDLAALDVIGLHKLETASMEIPPHTRQFSFAKK